MPQLASFLMKTIHKGENPYTNFEFKEENVNLFKGWNSESMHIPEIVCRLRPKLIIETGSWLGGSAIKMAELCRDMNLDTAVICVDTWLGDHHLHLHDEWRPTLLYKDARPDFYKTFISNVIARGLQDYIIPISLPSISGARLLAHHGLKADLVYIDASHEKGDVLADLRAFWKVCAVGGVFMGDDYKDHWVSVPKEHALKGHVNNFDGLIQDWNLFAAEVGHPLTRYPESEKVWIEKKAESNEIYSLS